MPVAWSVAAIASAAVAFMLWFLNALRESAPSVYYRVVPVLREPVVRETGTGRETEKEQDLGFLKGIYVRQDSLLTEGDRGDYYLELEIDSSRTKVYGWFAGSFNFSTSDKNNFPVSYDIFPNKIELNQAVVYVERLPDTVQTSHFDWGYHVTGFYGIDYRFTTAKGYFSEQLLQSNKQYGFDPVLEYFDLYFPVKDGLNIRIGRFLSVPGIEAQLAPNITT
jgi:hypothetical protein